MKFRKKWQNSGDVPLLIASSAPPEQGGKKQGLSALPPWGPRVPTARGEGRQAEEEIRAELGEIKLEAQ